MYRDPLVNFYVADVDASVRFYTELFGFEETFRTPATGRPDHVMLRLGGLMLGLADFEAAKRDHGLPAAPGPTRAEVAIWTDDVDAAYADLIANGAGPLTPPHDFIGTLRAAWVLDPDGGPIQIVMRLS
ncbi:MAG TPA: VOC family protein [Thermomicrobiales bacterium]|nr:VOC family protein [Thermomicrobiales bacterium]